MVGGGAGGGLPGTVVGGGGFVVGGGAAGGLPGTVVGGGGLVTTTGGGGGGTGVSPGGAMHDDRSKKRNSSAFPCGLSGVAPHSVGKGLLGSELSPPVTVPSAKVTLAFS